MSKEEMIRKISEILALENPWVVSQVLSFSENMKSEKGGAVNE